MTARQHDGNVPVAPPAVTSRQPRRLRWPWRVVACGTIHGAVACVALLTILRAAGWETALPPLLAVTPYASTPLLLAVTPYVGIPAGALSIVALATRLRGAAVITVLLLAAHLAWRSPHLRRATTGRPASGQGAGHDGQPLRRPHHS